MGNSRGVDFERDRRFTSGILTIPEANVILDIPIDTVQAWVGQRSDRPQVVTRIRPAKRGWPSIPLVGMVEASTLRALRAQNLPNEDVMAAARWYRGLAEHPYPLADQRLVTDGFRAFIAHPDNKLTRLVYGQEAFRESVEQYLRPVVWAEDHYPEAFRVERIPGVVIDPRFNAGRMSFERNRVPVFAVAGSLEAGEPLDEVADMYHLTQDEVGAVDEWRDWLEVAA